MDNAQHKALGIEYFNNTWMLIDKQNRTPEEDNLLLHSAHASRYHWQFCGSALEFARGEWQCSYVYSLLKNGMSALYHAEYSLKLCIENSIGDFDLFFAYEAMARAYSIVCDKANTSKYLNLAKSALDQIKNQEDKDYAASTLKTIIL